MASELKPCPFCGSSDLETYYADIEGWIAHIKCIDCDDMIGPMSEFKYETQEEAYEDASKRWNTRPTPVAPVSPDATGKCGELDYYTASDVMWSLEGHDPKPSKMGQWVKRSQAEELLAAKEAERAEQWRLRREMEADRETQKAIAASLEADNAAKDARIEELDRCHEGTIDLCNQKTAQIEALEAKLTAAEKALEGLREKGRKVLDVLKAWEDDGDLVNSGKIVSDFRAVLGGKPS